MSDLQNTAHIALGYGCNLARVYYKDREFVCVSMSRESYLPFVTTKLNHMAEYVFELLQTSRSEVDFNFNYPNTFPKRKIKKINQLLKEKNCSKNILIKWLSLFL